jgi:hypothetical protein
MAKKKKRRKPSGGRPAGKPKAAAGPAAAPAPAAPAEAGAAPQRTAKERREIAEQRRAQRLRRQRMRVYGIAALIVALIAGILGVRWFLERQSLQAYQTLARTADCGDVQRVKGDREHWERPGDPVPEYTTKPPAAGNHHIAPLPAGIHEEPLKSQITEQPSIYQAVHSLEHGYVIVWHGEIDTDTKGDLERALRGQKKVILTPYPEMPDGQTLALTAWERLQYCGEVDVEVVEAFIEQYREKTGPESSST